MLIRKLGFGAAMLYFFLTPITQARLVRVGPISVVLFLGIAALVLLSLEFATGIRPALLFAPAWWVPLFVLFVSLVIGLLEGPGYAVANSGGFIAGFALPVGLASFMLRELPRMVKVSLSLALGLAVAALVQIFNEVFSGQSQVPVDYASLSKSLLQARAWEAAAELGIQNAYGCLAMAICAAACAAVALGAEKRSQRWSFAALALVLLIGQSRGGYMVSSIVAAVGVAAAFLWNVRAKRRLRSIVVFLLLPVAVVYLAVRFGYLQAYDLGWRLDKIRASGVMDDDSIAERWDAVKLSRHAFRSNPVTGIGLQGWFFDRESPINKHSSIVDVLAELGVLGFCAYYAWLVGSARRAFNAWRTLRPGNPSRSIACAAGVAALAFLVGSMLNPVFLQPILNEVLVCLAALSVALREDVRRESSGIADGGKPPEETRTALDPA